MNKYEMIYILDTACTDEKRDALIEKIENVVLKADLAEFEEFLFCPDSSDRVMRAGKNAKGGFRSCGFFCKVIKIYGIFGTVEDKFASENGSSVCFNA